MNRFNTTLAFVETLPVTELNTFACDEQGDLMGNLSMARLLNEREKTFQRRMHEARLRIKAKRDLLAQQLQERLAMDAIIELNLGFDEIFSELIFTPQTCDSCTPDVKCVHHECVEASREWYDGVFPYIHY